MIFLKRKTGRVSLIEIIRAHNTIIYITTWRVWTCTTILTIAIQVHVAGRRFRDAKNTVDTNANLLSKSQGCFPLTGREWREWREYRNGKLLGFEKFKCRCCKKKRLVLLLEPLSKSKRGIWPLKLKKIILRFFEKRKNHSTSRMINFHRISTVFRARFPTGIAWRPLPFLPAFHDTRNRH